MKGNNYYIVNVKTGKLAGATFSVNPPVVGEGFIVTKVKPRNNKQKFDLKTGWK